MTITTELIEPSSSLWTEILAGTAHDFYHLPCYQQLSAQPEDRPRGFVATAGEHRVLVPFLQRPIPADLCGEEGLFDTASPYGYPGPLISEGAPGEFIREAFKAFENKLSEERVIAGFFRLHTLLNQPSDFEGVGEIVGHGPSVFIDLTLSEEELWKQTRRGHKRDLVVLQERGYEITMDDWDRLDDFLTCYYDSMRRLHAAPFYFFPKSYFEQLRNCVGSDRIHLCLVRAGEEIACAGLVTEMDGLCQYHLSATADPHFQDHPSKLMLHHLRGWLKARGNRIFHIGGGVGALRDTLHLFKSGFSPNSSDFYTWRIVSDPVRYCRALDHWAKAAGRPPVDKESFFPQYRAPLQP